MPDADQLEKVKFTDKCGNIETLWAFSLGNNRYKLDNTPWFAYSVSWQDIIEARWTETEDFPEFVRVIEKSGYRTLRLILEPPANVSPTSQSILDQLQKMDCSYEGANPKFIAVDVPAHVDLMAVRNYLISTGQQWEHADPTYRDLFPAEDDESENTP